MVYAIYKLRQSYKIAVNSGYQANLTRYIPYIHDT